MQVIAPLFHEDGDMVDLFLDLPKSPDEPIRISDHGMTLMRLSYSYDVDTPTKRRISDRILSENGVVSDNGRLSIEAVPGRLYPTLLQFAQTVAKVSNMQAFKREMMQSLFYEMLDDFVGEHLTRYHPQRDYVPIEGREDLEVDWRFPVSSKSIFLYGVKDSGKARLAALSCLQFQLASVPFSSVIVHEDFENGLSKKDQARITNTVDKQFTSLEDFKREAEQYFARETEATVPH
ncbi:MAG: DUF1828 domain-containing protein [Acidobacteriaceae bacterium]